MSEELSSPAAEIRAHWICPCQVGSRISAKMHAKKHPKSDIPARSCCYTRLVTDHATFGYMCDVYVLKQIHLCRQAGTNSQYDTSSDVTVSVTPGTSQSMLSGRNNVLLSRV